MVGKNTGGFHYPFGEDQRPIEQVGQNDCGSKGNRGGLDSNSFARCHFHRSSRREQQNV